MAVNAVKKITTREILKGKPERHTIKVPDANDATKTVDKLVAVVQDLCVIFGQAHTMEPKSSLYGPYQEFIGRFEARRLKDGEIFQATRVIFPAIAEDIASNYFLDAKREDPAAMVNMAFVVGVEPDTRGVEGYKFTIKPVETGEVRNDPLDALRVGMVAGLQLALADPNKSAGLLDLKDVQLIEGSAKEVKKGKGSEETPA